MLRTLSIVWLIASSAIAQSELSSQVPGATRQRVNAAPVWVILVDDLHLDFTSTGHIQELLRTIAGQLPEDGDLAGIVSTGPSSIAFDLTKDRTQIGPMIKKVSGAALKPSEILNEMDSQHSEVRYRAHVALSTVDDVVTMLGRVASPHKALVYLSNGYNVDVRLGTPPSDTNPFLAKDKIITDERLRAEVAELTHQATRANVTIYAINVGAMREYPTRDSRVQDPAVWDKYRATTRRSLEVISEETGGFAIRDDLEGGLRRISAMMHR
jgi:VWFA-related protein